MARRRWYTRQEGRRPARWLSSSIEHAPKFRCGHLRWKRRTRTSLVRVRRSRLRDVAACGSREVTTADFVGQRRRPEGSRGWIGVRAMTVTDAWRRRLLRREDERSERRTGRHGKPIIDGRKDVIRAVVLERHGTRADREVQVVRGRSAATVPDGLGGVGGRNPAARRKATLVAD